MQTESPFRNFTGTHEIPRIGMLLDDFNVDRWFMDIHYFTETIKSLGGQVMIKVAYSDAEKQNSQAQELINLGVKVLVVVAVDNNSNAAIVNAAQTAGVKTILYDRMIYNCRPDFFITYNPIVIGKLQAQYALRIKPKGVYILISGPESDSNSRQLREGQMEVLQPYISRGDIKILHEKQTNDWSELEAFYFIEHILENGEDIDAVIAANDALALGAIMALEQYDLDGKVVVTGQDAELEACRQLLAERQTMTVYKSIKKQATIAAETAMKFINKENVHFDIRTPNGKHQIPSIFLQPVVVDAYNLKETVIEDKHISEKDLYDIE